MPLKFNTLLRESGLDPRDVRLVRHKDRRSSSGRSPYELWRDDRKAFEEYQARQTIADRKKFDAPVWASFVVDAFDDTMFVGLYNVEQRQLLEENSPMLHVVGGIDSAGSCDIYALSPDEKLKDLAERLIIDWGRGKRAWVQRADFQDKGSAKCLAPETASG